jgi:hypothetical protein
VKKLADEVNDPEASDNDRFVIYTHLQNAVVAARQLPSVRIRERPSCSGKRAVCPDRFRRRAQR